MKKVVSVFVFLVFANGCARAEKIINDIDKSGPDDSAIIKPCAGLDKEAGVFVEYFQREYSDIIMAKIIYGACIDDSYEFLLRYLYTNGNVEQLYLRLSDNGPGKYLVTEISRRRLK